MQHYFLVPDPTGGLVGLLNNVRGRSITPGEISISKGVYDFMTCSKPADWKIVGDTLYQTVEPFVRGKIVDKHVSELSAVREYPRPVHNRAINPALQPLQDEVDRYHNEHVRRQADEDFTFAKLAEIEQRLDEANPPAEPGYYTRPK